MAVLIPIARYFNPSIEASMVGISALFTNGEGLTIDFQVERSITSTPDSCRVSICGLDPVRAQAMGALFQATGTSKLSMRFGYDGVLGGLFVGDVRRFVSQRRSGTDVWTDAEADDGGQSYDSVVVRISNVGMTAQQMIELAALYMGLTVSPQAYQVIASSDATKQGPYTAVMTAAAHDLLDAAARRLGCRWWVRDTQIFLASFGQPDTTRPAIVVFPDTLVGDVATGGSGEMSFPVMLDPNIVPGGQVSYQGTRIRVDRVIHSGASRGKLCTSAVEGRAL